MEIGFGKSIGSSISDFKNLIIFASLGNSFNSMYLLFFTRIKTGVSTILNLYLVLTFCNNSISEKRIFLVSNFFGSNTFLISFLAFKHLPHVDLYKIIKWIYWEYSFRKVSNVSSVKIVISLFCYSFSNEINNNKLKIAITIKFLFIFYYNKI